MPDYLNISDFLSPVDLNNPSQGEVFKDGQLGKIVQVYDEKFPDLDDADIVIVGCGEQRGSGMYKTHSNAPDIIRGQFYSLFYWHTDVRIADTGNIKNGSSQNDSFAA